MLKLILGSQSPRRAQLLKEMGALFEVEVFEIDETPNSHLSPEQTAVDIALRKANGFRALAHDELLITADTIVVHKNIILGKPSDAEDAKRMLSALSGSMHEVFTAFVLKHHAQTYSFQDLAKVYFRDIPKSSIDFYVKNFRPFDKAGSYGVQEWLGHHYIERIDGAYSTVMGLPTSMLSEALVRFFPDSFNSLFY
jgi:septum formation protein